ncbi:hypothetical protein GUITHDRAFT_102378 [Guillardia theta CCMP2712]|uniref:Uncharacterized protein n=1 Tax=Guillardia theta (strain CCMP2712) TaxID=905079 RepID=L1JTP7_GUITC|nr:hypothetical protein GUITHDRAFT_102378 [Guillardia theta CCMP2712]EKX51772.1 hypothetical protein GUITHDRAFT_102378 [Guillardia theta CCMP2712]|eukprot:XP_005838752.1 hypothetical protein GUITHDRAFT_102378 [Guillardia theta CCMP2712]
MKSFEITVYLYLAVLLAGGVSCLTCYSADRITASQMLTTTVDCTSALLSTQALENTYKTSNIDDVSETSDLISEPDMLQAGFRFETCQIMKNIVDELTSEDQVETSLLKKVRITMNFCLDDLMYNHCSEKPFRPAK